jgi:hypothetical protein
MRIAPLARKYFTLKSPNLFATSAPLVRNRLIEFASERFLQLFFISLDIDRRRNPTRQVHGEWSLGIALRFF